jgi:hypothetical protein
MQGITKIETGRAMENHREVLHELPMRVPKESTEGDKCRPSYKLLHAGITFIPQRTRVYRTQAWKTSNNHSKSQAINRLNYHWSQSTPILEGEGIIVMCILNGRRAKGGGSA